VADEFPTLEVALAASVLWLAFRGVLLGRDASGIGTRVTALCGAIERGDAAQLAEFGRGPAATWLGPIARSAAAGFGRKAADGQLGEQLLERTARAERRLRNGAGRDLVVCSVLGGSLVYAGVTNLGVAPAFYGLGAAAALLLLIAVPLRLSLAKRLKAAVPAVERALGARAAAGLGSGDARRCRVCGQTELTRLTASELGPKLGELGVTEALFCPGCGHLWGRRGAPE
jgi:hypothetical protein